MKRALFACLLTGLTLFCFSAPPAQAQPSIKKLIKTMCQWRKPKPAASSAQLEAVLARKTYQARRTNPVCKISIPHDVPPAWIQRISILLNLQGQMKWGEIRLKNDGNFLFLPY